MASKSKDSEIAVLQTQMEEVIKRLDQIQEKLEEQTKNYVSREEFAAFKARSWTTHTMTGLISAIISGLVIFFFTKVI